MASPGTADLRGNRYGHLPWRKNVVNLSTVKLAVTYEVSPDESGTLFVIAADATTAHLSLPKISSLSLGLYYEFFISSQVAVQDVNIVSTNDSSADILLFGADASSADPNLSTDQAFTPFDDITAVPNYLSVTAISSVRWFAEAGLGMFKTGTSDDSVIAEDIVGAWTTGTTKA